jgi:hypothetical protein
VEDDHRVVLAEGDDEGLGPVGGEADDGRRLTPPGDRTSEADDEPIEIGRGGHASLRAEDDGGTDGGHGHEQGQCGPAL